MLQVHTSTSGGCLGEKLYSGDERTVAQHVTVVACGTVNTEEHRENSIIFSPSLPQ